MSRIVLNSFFNIVGTVAEVVIAFFLTPYVIHHLGTGAYGIWVTIGSVTAYSYLLNVGISNSVTRFVPIAITKVDKPYLNSIMSTSTTFYGFGGLVTGVLTLILGPFTPTLFNASGELASATLIAFMCTGLSLAVTMPIQTSLGFLTGIQRYDVVNGVRCSTAIIRSIAIVVFLALGYGLIAMSVIGGIIQLLTFLGYWIFAKILVPDLKLSWEFVDWKLFRELISFGFNTFIYVIGSLLIYKTDLIIIGILLGPTDVAIYAIPVLLMGLISTFVTAATKVMQPAAAVEYAKGNTSQLGSYYKLGLRYTTLALIPVMALLVTHGDDFVRLWMGPDFNMAGKLLPILVVAHFFYISQRSSFEVLSAANRHKFFGRITIATGLTNIILSTILVTQFHMGLWGIVWGTFVSMMILSCLVLFFYCCNELKVSKLEVISKSYMAGFISVVPLLIVAVTCNIFWPVTTWLILIIQIFLSILAWIAVLWPVVLNKGEKQRVLNELSRIKQRFTR